MFKACQDELERGTDQIVVNELIAATLQAISTHVAHDLTWTRQSRRGRWMVIAPELSRLSNLRDLPADVRATIDAAAERRGRRFSSLSRARAFARLIGGRVERRGRRTWRHVSPWERATRYLDATFLASTCIHRLEIAP